MVADGVEPAYVRSDILPDFFKHFWVRRMALDQRNAKPLIETTVAIANKVRVRVAVCPSLSPLVYVCACVSLSPVPACVRVCCVCVCVCVLGGVCGHVGPPARRHWPRFSGFPEG